jgi:hypothetical protein
LGSPDSHPNLLLLSPFFLGDLADHRKLIPSYIHNLSIVARIPLIAILVSSLPIWYYRCRKGLNLGTSHWRPLISLFMPFMYFFALHHFMREFWHAARRRVKLPLSADAHPNPFFIVDVWWMTTNILSFAVFFTLMFEPPLLFSGALALHSVTTIVLVHHVSYRLSFLRVKGQ